MASIVGSGEQETNGDNSIHLDPEDRLSALSTCSRAQWPQRVRFAKLIVQLALPKSQPAKAFTGRVHWPRSPAAFIGSVRTTLTVCLTVERRYSDNVFITRFILWKLYKHRLRIHCLQTIPLANNAANSASPCTVKRSNCTKLKLGKKLKVLV